MLQACAIRNPTRLLQSVVCRGQIVQLAVGEAQSPPRHRRGFGLETVVLREYLCCRLGMLRVLQD
jgi:hypothetical protein